ncbi:ADP-ribose pyrophosphatase [Nostoc linckia z18]|jgi:ADP-ribose pyrophosphatase YjhB (NUDIX family)|uniref:ADP-ribose pyrophosphatase n=2 Tax=Nostoc linckia TaxID=92942 RepID=A0A9Q5ZA84_NOSLI|nr:NUDIX hydrolase [Nostoc linckia]PHK35433.1 ADP-ribose pyrophosphatase [Nostoc linckia z15]PHK44400.1 ADP-ribose pyrophosphatase [Nostoc linckia z16]PHJ58621.1 ADP-ribose pyrophosphatase [Nostoc linckia z1]PHJ61335.1 ADP-ribose pyrophosphatase [Nostoc linckia z3]PHJ72338.1 ADP-ribose pyrophosphatase [Nostoc linckia z2]
MEPKWLEWSQKLQAIAQNGLTYSEGVYDIERYKQLRAVATEIMATYSNVEHSYLLDLFSGEVGYATPKVDVRGAIFRDDTILLVKERADGLWTLPGGWADVGESPSEVVVKEVYEESGYQTRATKLLAVYDRDKQGHPPFPFYVYKLFFKCELIGGSPSSSIETEAVDFFPEDALPELSIGRVTPTQIARLFQHYRQPDLPTDFD